VAIPKPPTVATPKVPTPVVPPVAVAPPPAAGEVYRSPFELAFSPSGQMLAVSDRTAAMAVIIDVASSRVAKYIQLTGEPTGLVWGAGSKRLYVAELGAGAVAEIDVQAGKVIRRLPVPLRPVGLALAQKKNLLLTANTATNDVWAIDLASGSAKGRIELAGTPWAVAVTPDESLAIVGSLYPSGTSSDEDAAASIWLIDLDKLTRAAEIRLPAGSAVVRDLVVSPDGRWAYASHNLGRTNLPTSQLDRGWVNTNAMTIIDLRTRKHYATVLLDRAGDGAANPWGLALAKDGQRLWVALSGVHEVANIDLSGLHELLTGQGDPAQYKTNPPNVWLDIRKDPANRRLLADRLAALYSAGLITRTRIPGNGPRGLDVSPDGRKLAAACYYTGQVAMLDPQTQKPTASVPVGPQRPAAAARRGEMIFHDADYCYQRWLSCATCHPDGRADGLNWDLLNDGMGNPKNTKSLLWSHKTPPAMATGIRSGMEIASAAGFRFILFRQPEGDELEDVRTFLRSMKPARSPYRLPDGKLTDQALRGKVQFDDAKVGCNSCHTSTGGLFTDLQKYDVGTAGRLDDRKKFDTPSLVELWRSPPYLHNGSAATLADVLTTRNKGDRHGRTSHLTKQQLQDLLMYLLSL